MKYPVLYALVCFIFFSCKKESHEPPPVIIHGTLAKEFYHKQVDQVRVFYYNNDSTLNHYEYFFDSTRMELHEFRYFLKQLVSIDHYETKSNAGGPVRQQLPQYDDRNRLSLITVVYPSEFDTVRAPNVIEYPYRYVFLYDNESSTRFSTCISYQRINNVLTAFGKDKFEYDDQGNITVIEHYDIQNGIETKQWTTVYEYLQQKNPKYHLDDILDFESYYSPNIWQQKTTGYFTTGTISIYKRNYEFNAAGKVTSFTEQPGGAKRYYEYY